MSIIDRLTQFVQRVFKTNLETFFDALKLSPNAQGYVSGSISELLLKKKLEEEYRMEVKRIREKWEGKKHHHGDIYFRKRDGGPWYVMESKGGKSNSEKWHKLYNYQNLKRFMIAHADKISWIDQTRNVEEQVVQWIEAELPKFKNDFLSPLYEYEEVQRYKPPVRINPKVRDKADSIAKLTGSTREEINRLISQRLAYVMSKVKVLETHFVSGTSATSARTQATPRKDEFHAIAIDIVLRYPEHKFLFANPQNLDSSADDANHLLQNYIMGFVFYDKSGNERLSITTDWYENFNDVYETLDSSDAVDEGDMQVDNRSVVIEPD